MYWLEELDVFMTRPRQKPSIAQAVSVYLRVQRHKLHLG